MIHNVHGSTFNSIATAWNYKDTCPWDVYVRLDAQPRDRPNNKTRGKIPCRPKDIVFLSMTASQFLFFCIIL